MEPHLSNRIPRCCIATRRQCILYEILFVLTQYDGIHYDAVESSNGDRSSVVRVFDPLDAAVEASVLAIAQDMNRLEKFTDTCVFTLRCLVCNEGLEGSKDAEEHAKLTKHINYCEY